jgi:hypothetical protein
MRRHMQLVRQSLAFVNACSLAGWRSAGLVWHTDAAAWQAGEDSDPDVVDWDIDTRIHYRYTRDAWSGFGVRRLPNFE